jgi:hypothetical protein
MPKSTTTPEPATNVADLLETIAENPVATAEKFLLSGVLPLVLSKLGLPRSLETIIGEVLPGEDRFDLRRAFKRLLQRRVTAQEGRSGADMLARAIVKQIDAHYEIQADKLTLLEKHAVVTELAQNIARQLVLAADVITQYPALAYAVNDGKARSDVRGIATARAARTLMVEDLKQALINSARAACGDDVVG